MKKIASLLVLFLVIFGLYACNDKPLTEDEQAVDTGKKVLMLAGDLKNVSASIEIPFVVKGDVAVTWSTENTDIVSIANDEKIPTKGKLIFNRPAFEQGDKMVTVKATLKKNEVVATKEFELRVLKNIQAPEAYSTAAQVVAAKNGDVLKVKGVVTSRTVTTTATFDAYIQEGNNGYMIYKISSDYVKDFAVGNEVECVGLKAVYSNLHEVDVATGFHKVLSTGKALPGYANINSIVAASATNTALNAALLPYQSTLVELTVVIDTLPTSTSAAYDIKVKAGSATYTFIVRVDNKQEAAVLSAINAKVATLKKGDTITVKGIVGIYGSNTQIMLRDASHLVVVPA